MANLAITVVTKNGIWYTFDGLVNEAELVLVYLGCCVFWDTATLSPEKPKLLPKNEVNEHEDKFFDPNRYITKCMDDVKTTLPSPHPSPLNLMLWQNEKSKNVRGNQGLNYRRKRN